MMSVEATCIECRQVFCCSKCRWNHEQTKHKLQFDCPICRGASYLCKPQELNESFVKHLVTVHFPLHCKVCFKLFSKMDDLTEIEKCTSISELIGSEIEDIENKPKNVDEKFDSLYEKVVIGESENGCLNKTSKTAIVSPIVRKQNLVGYESSDSENENDQKQSVMRTPHPKLVPKTPKLKRQRAATPHVKKLLRLMRQKWEEEFEDTVDAQNNDASISIKHTPSRNEDVDTKTEMTTPTSHIQLLQLTQTVTTSTPTNSECGGWSLFQDQGADSPLSEIETTESPGQAEGKTHNEAPKLKSIIVTNSKLRLGSQDSSEKQVTFQDSASQTDTSKVKKVTFAEDTVFEQEPKVKRVYRKPKRMLTPGPQKPKLCSNPRFQALINRFESKCKTVARTPVNYNRDKVPDSTPPIGEYTHMPARAIDFKDDSPVADIQTPSRETTALFRTCEESPAEGNEINNAITTFTSNIAGTLQNCVTNVLKANEEETEIQFKFVITKKRVTVKRTDNEYESVDEKSSELERDSVTNKENLWYTVAKAVKNVFWSDQGNNFITPSRSWNSIESNSSSGSKRKCGDLSDSELSPLNHKRYKYEGRIKGRPPLRRCRTSSVSQLRSSHSAEQPELVKEISKQDDVMNQSF